MGRVSDIPTEVIRTHLQKWFLDSPTMTKDQTDEEKKTLDTWKEARCTCRWFATEAFLPPSLDQSVTKFDGSRWTTKMFSRKSKTMMQCKWPSQNEAVNPKAFGEMLLRTLTLTPDFSSSRIRVDIWNTSPPDKCREWHAQVGITGYDLVTTCQNVAPEVVRNVSTIDSLSPMGLMRAADYAREKGEKYENVHTLCGWVGAREFDKEAWLDEWLVCFPNLIRLSLFFPFCTTVSNWNGVTDCIHLRELRIDLVNCNETAKHIPNGLLGGDALPNLQILCVSRMQAGHSLNLLSGRPALPELQLGGFNVDNICELDLSALGEVFIGRLLVTAAGTPDPGLLRATVEGIVGSACHPNTEVVLCDA